MDTCLQLHFAEKTLTRKTFCPWLSTVGSLPSTYARYWTYERLESKHCLLLNEAGKRFVDESLGDEIVNQYLAKQENRRGFLLFEYALLVSQFSAKMSQADYVSTTVRERDVIIASLLSFPMPGISIDSRWHALMDVMSQVPRRRKDLSSS